MNDQFIQGVIFDWDKIDKDSYLKGIRAFKGSQRGARQHSGGGHPLRAGAHRLPERDLPAG